MTNNQSDRAYILVVEDDPDLRAVHAEILHAEGYEVRSAAHGLEALEVMDEAGAPALVLLDLRMPHLDGWELAARMRARPGWSDIPLIVVAAHYAIADEAKALGATAWLHKPTPIDDLVRVVARAYHQPTDEVAS